MAVRSRLLAAVASIPVGVSTDVYTVPGGRTAIVRHWSVVNQTGETRRVLLSVRTGGTVVRFASRPVLLNDETWQAAVAELVVNPGDSIAAYHSGTGTHGGLHVVLAGSLLEGAPA